MPTARSYAPNTGPLPAAATPKPETAPCAVANQYPSALRTVGLPSGPNGRAVVGGVEIVVPVGATVVVGEPGTVVDAVGCTVSGVVEPGTVVATPSKVVEVEL